MTENPTPAPTATFWPTSTPYPTASGTPTSSPFPTSSPWPTMSATPTVSPFPTMTAWPTMSATPTASPFPTASATPTQSPWPSPGPSASWPSPGPSASPLDDTTNIVTSSVGYSHSCNSFTGSGDGLVETDVVFTYIAEAKTTSIDFLTDLEVHLLDHAASEALECFEDSSLHVYRVGYPTTEAASEAKTCEVTHPEALACWILQTHLVVTSDESSAVAAKENVLSLLDLELTDGSLAEEDFPQLAYTEYLGPDPVETNLLGNANTSPQTDGGNSDGSDTTLYSVSIASAALAILSLVAFFSLYIYVRNRRNETGVGEDMDGDDTDAETVEISELLEQSRRRLQERPPVPSSRSIKEDDSDDVYEVDVSELLATKEGRRMLRRDLTISSYQELTRSSSERSRSTRSSPKYPDGERRSSSSKSEEKETSTPPSRRSSRSSRPDNRLAVPSSPLSHESPLPFRPEHYIGSAESSLSEDRHSMSSSSRKDSKRRMKPRESLLYMDPEDGTERILAKRSSKSGRRVSKRDYRYLSSKDLDAEGHPDRMQGKDIV